MQRIVGIILLVLGILAGVLSVFPSELAGQLNGVGSGSAHLTADVLLGAGLALFLLGCTLALSAGPAPHLKEEPPTV